ncbi:acyloxyacyl hydrolase [Chryseobacterium sp. Tr-659]|uniref:acyloxyacyl hydrolase n=1 Tax=Chryseobacterium sp. Tr-659 TaxID=2608340 RepID=UPI0014228DA6|nr:acyloxyacyl hydrolase [Chryseobacterium sp. Tr-659]
MISLFISTLTFSQTEDSLSAPIQKRQEDKKKGFRYIDIVGHTGVHAYTGKGLSDKLNHGYGAVEARFGWYPKDKDNWSGFYGNPSYGVGVYSGFIGDPQTLGKPNAVFGFISFPLSKKAKRNFLFLSPSLGITYDLEPFDPNNNADNDAIGSRMAVYFGLSLFATYVINREIDLVYGVDVSHFSNGRTSAPNHGLNMIGINLGLRYNYNADRKFNRGNLYTSDSLSARFSRNIKIPNKKIRSGELGVYGALGFVQNDEDKGSSLRYTTASFITEYRYLFNNMHAVSGGIDWFLDHSIRDNSSSRNMFGFHFGYDFMFWKLSVRLQAGSYIGNNNGKGPFFLRPAIRYDISPLFFTQIGLKTVDGAAADWVEFGIGMNVLKRKIPK